METTKKKAFTLVELLAVIVILAILLVMAVPKILEVIKASKVSSMEDSAKLIAKTAEQKKLEKEALGDNTSISCSEVAEYNSNDYDSCNITFNNGVATITLKGKGKFDKLTCTGTKDNMECTESNNSEPEWLYAFVNGEINNASQGVENYSELKDSNGKQRSVFIKFKSDLSEKYVCTMYDSTKSDGFGSEPHCLLSKGAYNTRNETGSQWSQVKVLFGASNCSEHSSGVSCSVNLSSSYWHCNANSDGNVGCGWSVADGGAGCNALGAGNAGCGE